MNCCISITSVEDPNNTTPRPRPQLQTQRDRSSKWLKFYPIFKLQIKDKLHILQITPRVLENYPDLSDFSFSGQLRDIDSFSSMLGNRQLHCNKELYCALPLRLDVKGILLLSLDKSVCHLNLSLEIWVILNISSLQPQMCKFETKKSMKSQLAVGPRPDALHVNAYLVTGQEKYHQLWMFGCMFWFIISISCRCILYTEHTYKS